MKFAERLTELRRNQGWTQEDVANLLGIARTTYAMYEQSRREPELKTICMLGDLYNVSIDYLLGRTDDPTPPKPATAVTDMIQGSGDKEVTGSKKLDDAMKSDIKRISGQMESEYDEHDPAMANFLYKVIRNVLREFDQFKKDQQTKGD
ncbi:helix-turn-helix domain-containing protein [Alicyclobacillus fastidiosus]|uniref:Helix-turn-helix transcriptional regulator n=1 Tax=Alicyclobacillus fastidiosus TaxID=392011 RepID=A0ABV5ALN4_9BACL|nr:helix-turn-helix transcriptional regulator [Alicyclobacillus fastidiosus]WEH08516.1 helix-turn-helix transcriptional regulator [Alicyclobacillus fastidiosus]